MNGRRGATLVESLVAVALAALAAGVLAAGVSTGVRAFSLATGVDAQVVAVHDGLERLRATPPGSVDDTVGTAPVIARRRSSSDGRGQPDPLLVETTVAGGHRFAVASEHRP
jgi:hypothetical protein